MIAIGSTKERPPNFRLNPNSPLFGGLVFAGLGGLNCPWTDRYADSSPFGNHGTLTNMDPPTDWVWVPELGRFGLDFDGSDDRISLGSPLALTLARPCTLAAWVNVTDVSVIRGIISKYNTSSQRSYRFEINTSSRLTAWLSAGGTTGTSIGTSSGTVTAGAWSHVAMRLNATTVDWFVNGVKSTNANSTAIYAGTAAVDVGCAYNSGTLPFLGEMADVAVYERALSDSKIAAIADPSNAMLSVGGCPLILPPRRTIFASAAAAPPVTARRAYILGGGIAV